MVAHNAGILRPDMFRTVILSSVPYGSRTEGAVKPTDAMRRRVPLGQQFYQTYFQMPRTAEKEFAADPKRTLRMFLYSLSGSIPNGHKWRYVFGENEKVLDGCVDPKQLPAWLKPEDLDYCAEEYSRTGFRGGLNWSVPHLSNKVLLPGVGHWTEQEAPSEVNRLMLEFLVSVDGTDAAN
jgi:pimeloyl-ACP methyl ester carboxylesterase